MREVKVNIIMPFDTETTGLPDWKQPSDSPQQPHLVQLAAHQVDADTRKVLQTLDVIIRPDGWEIPDEVAEIHGITTEHAMDVGIPEKLALEMFLAMWNGATQLAHNATFDRRIIRIGTKRYFDEAIQARWNDCEYRCTMNMAKPIMQMLPRNRYGYKSPKLVEAYPHFTGKELQGAHRAINDVNACLEVYWQIMDRQGVSGDLPTN